MLYHALSQWVIKTINRKCVTDVKIWQDPFSPTKACGKSRKGKVLWKTIIFPSANCTLLTALDASVKLPVWWFCGPPYSANFRTEWFLN